jgi:hypothetical protein
MKDNLDKRGKEEKKKERAIWGRSARLSKVTRRKKDPILLIYRHSLPVAFFLRCRKILWKVSLYHGIKTEARLAIHSVVQMAQPILYLQRWSKGVVQEGAVLWQDQVRVP